MDENNSFPILAILPEGFFRIQVLWNKGSFVAQHEEPGEMQR